MLADPKPVVAVDTECADEDIVEAESSIVGVRSYYVRQFYLWSKDGTRGNLLDHREGAVQLADDGYLVQMTRVEAVHNCVEVSIVLQSGLVAITSSTIARKY